MSSTGPTAVPVAADSPDATAASGGSDTATPRTAPRVAATPFSAATVVAIPAAGRAGRDQRRQVRPPGACRRPRPRGDRERAVAGGHREQQGGQGVGQPGVHRVLLRGVGSRVAHRDPGRERTGHRAGGQERGAGHRGRIVGADLGPVDDDVPAPLVGRQDPGDQQPRDGAVGEAGVEDPAPGEAERVGRRDGQDHLTRPDQAGVGGPDGVDGGGSRTSGDDEHGRQRDPGAGDGEGAGDVVGEAGRAVAFHGHLPGELRGPLGRVRVGGGRDEPAEQYREPDRDDHRCEDRAGPRRVRRELGAHQRRGDPAARTSGADPREEPDQGRSEQRGRAHQRGTGREGEPDPAVAGGRRRPDREQHPGGERDHPAEEAAARRPTSGTGVVHDVQRRRPGRPARRGEAPGDREQHAGGGRSGERPGGGGHRCRPRGVGGDEDGVQRSSRDDREDRARRCTEEPHQCRLGEHEAAHPAGQRAGGAEQAQLAAAPRDGRRQRGTDHDDGRDRGEQRESGEELVAAPAHAGVLVRLDGRAVVAGQDGRVRQRRRDRAEHADRPHTRGEPGGLGVVHPEAGTIRRAGDAHRADRVGELHREPVARADPERAGDEHVARAPRTLPRRDALPAEDERGDTVTALQVVGVTDRSSTGQGDRGERSVGHRCRAGRRGQAVGEGVGDRAAPRDPPVRARGRRRHDRRGDDQRRGGREAILDHRAGRGSGEQHRPSNPTPTATVRTAASSSRHRPRTLATAIIGRRPGPGQRIR